jgi:hypothetical protein
MAAPIAALPWLMRGAWPWLMRGKGINLPLRKTAQGVDKIIRPKIDPYSSRYTPVEPLKIGVRDPRVGGTTPGKVGGMRRWRENEMIPVGSKRVIGPTKIPAIGAGTKTAPALRYEGSSAVTKALPAGYARRHPFITGGVGASVLGTGYGMIAGDDEPMVAPSQPFVPQDPWGAPTDILNFAEQQEALAAEGKEQLSRMLNYGFGLATSGAKTDKFFERGMAILEQSKAYNESKHFADVVRAVYKEGDMPKNAREAYERLTPLVGPEQAAVLSGHQLGMEEGKTKEERIWNKIMEIAQYDIDSAAAELVAAWGTGRLKNPPVQSDPDIRFAKARRMISDLVGGTGLAEGVQNLERIDA